MKLSGFILEPMKQANLIKTNLIIIIIIVVEIEKNKTQNPLKYDDEFRNRNICYFVIIN